jgi:hypothetical protein
MIEQPNRTDALHLERNTVMPLDLEWVLATRVNKSATERRQESLAGSVVAARNHPD